MSELPKMNQYVKAKWVKALRSGKYKQSFGAMRSNYEPDKFCPLGVLTHLYCREKHKGWNNVVESLVALPKCVAHWARCSDNPVIGYSDYGYTVSVMTMNDGGRKSFNEIADMIEKNI